MAQTLQKANFKWNITKAVPAEKIESLSAAININPILASLLIKRGITTFNEAKRFFRPSLDDLHDPFLMKNMDVAVSLVLQAVEQGMHIRLYGDYDVDGTTAVSVMKNIFGHLHHKGSLTTYIPDRYSEGYGLSDAGVDDAIHSGVNVLITLDCGIRAIDKIQRLQEAGIRVIVCDHHLPGSDLPPAHAVLDPKQSGCNYPFKELSGCGVGFKLMQAVWQQTSLDDDILWRQLDLMAISIAADIVPITGENRIFTYFGLRRINESPQEGVQMLMDIAGLKPPLQVNNLVFGLAPRINAAGRMAHAHAVVDLFTNDGSSELVGQIDDHNRNRKDVDQYITEQALEQIAADSRERAVNVVYGEGWHKGVIGIVASRCMEYFYRPTIVFSINDGVATGSARSVKGFNIYNAIEVCSGYLTRFGGHDHAAGLSLKSEDLPKFIHQFEQEVAQTITEESCYPVIDIDEETSLERVNFRFHRIIEQMAPFGPANPMPVFMTRGLLADRYEILKEQHLKIFFSNEVGIISALGFGMAQKLQEIDINLPVDIVYHVDINLWQDRKTLYLRLKDIKQANDITG